MSLFVEAGEPLSRGDVVRRVGVEERVERLGRPGRMRDAVARRPAVDLAHVLGDERVPEIGPQRDRPEPVHRMRLAARFGAGERDAGGGARGSIVACSLAPVLRALVISSFQAG